MYRILVIEEDADIRTLLLLVLQRSRYLARGAATSRRGLELISEFQPDLVFVSLELAHMNSWALADKLKSRQSTLHIPVIALTTQELHAGASFHAYLSGFTDILSKPFNLDVVLAIVARHLPHMRPHQRPDIHVPAV